MREGAAAFVAGSLLTLVAQQRDDMMPLPTRMVEVDNGTRTAAICQEHDPRLTVDARGHQPRKVLAPQVRVARDEPMIVDEAELVPAARLRAIFADVVLGRARAVPRIVEDKAVVGPAPRGDLADEGANVGDRGMFVVQLLDLGATSLRELHDVLAVPRTREGVPGLLVVQGNHNHVHSPSFQRAILPQRAGGCRQALGRGAQGHSLDQPPELSLGPLLV
mmetsp:Transcript_100525/g.255761  ORF Transcript_100525/g.255761 Transcript_100525/m.255761 type:complete len:220 (+) Transcript_100525:1112-1771(+)